MSGAARAPVLPGGRHSHVDARAAALLVVLCLCWGVQQVAIKAAITHGMPPLLQAGLRSAGAALLLVAWSAWLPGRRRGAGARPMRPGAVWHGLALAAVFAAEFVAMYEGLRFTSAGRAVLLLYTAPLFVALGAHWLIPSERLDRRQGIGLLCAFAGVVVAVADGVAGGGAAHGAILDATLAGDALVLAGAVLWAATTLMIRVDPQLDAMTPDRILLFQLTGSAPVLLALSPLLGEALAPGQWGAVAWLALGYQVAVVAFASYLAWFWLVAHYPAARIGAFSFLTPLFGMAAGWALLGEPVSPRLLLALACVVVGLRLVNTRPRARLA